MVAMGMRMLRNEVIRVCCFGIEEVIFGFAIALSPAPYFKWLARIISISHIYSRYCSMFFGFYCCMAVQGPSVAIFGLHGCRGSAATLINGQLGSSAAVAARTLLVNKRLCSCSDSARP